MCLISPSHLYACFIDKPTNSTLKSLTSLTTPDSSLYSPKGSSTVPSTRHIHLFTMIY